ncbi:MAG: aspartate-semialdehyde dehydrogenase [Phenylobacterium sp.]|uniref:aspartate-semialdehyde dehydrogenase n=1 Tax=Phenylobacterium sp. TaxID=1871053 RepID=UPI001A4AE5B1|nr:aspartate-semialdehyde dehydrogenase [Phenylobacterium sp.]MBL8556088.1 aspartate-semialdehyde dehydrogenase [Phenylobacterium sp.]
MTFQSFRRAHPNVAILGATGAVGVELIRCLEQRDFPLARLKLLASPRSAGRKLAFRGEELTVDAVDGASFNDVDLALFSAGASQSKVWAPVAVAAGAVVVDNSSAFRMDPDCPLVVPEVNLDMLVAHRGVVANPNCVAIIATMAIQPLHRAFGLTRVRLSTYQAASGAGAAAMEELRASTVAHLAGETFTPQVLQHPYAFNLFSHDSGVDLDSGYNGEELKVVAETQRLLGRPNLPVGITSVRVPVLRAHTIAMTLEFPEPVSPDAARAALAGAPGVRIVDDRAANHFPMPSESQGQGDVLAGRFRTDLADPTGRSICLLVSGDQLLKGAALNAVQIAEHLFADAREQLRSSEVLGEPVA